MALDISCPGGSAPVVLQNAQTGFVCSWGGAFRVDNNGNNQVPTQVEAIITQGAGAQPANPPAGTTIATIDAVALTWSIPQLPGAVCAAGPGGAANNIWVWFTFAPGDIPTAAANFNGICANQTDCCGNGAGTGPGSGTSTGPGSGTGTGPGSGSGTGSGSGSGSGS